MPLDDFYSWIVRSVVIDAATTPARHPGREWKISKAGWVVIVIVIVGVFTYMGIRAFR